MEKNRIEQSRKEFWEAVERLEELLFKAELKAYYGIDLDEEKEAAKNERNC